LNDYNNSGTHIPLSTLIQYHKMGFPLIPISDDGVIPNLSGLPTPEERQSIRESISRKEEPLNYIYYRPEFWNEDRIEKEASRSKLRQEDKFTLAIDGLRYIVKDYNGKWLVFRRNIETGKARSSPIHDNETAAIVEIKVMPLSETNDCLQSERPEYQIFGSDPVKIINNEAYVLMVKRSGDTQR
jgi:hypothetical protein